MNRAGRFFRKLILLLMTVILFYLSVTSLFSTVYVTDAEHIFFCGDHLVIHLLTILFLLAILLFRKKKNMETPWARLYPVVLAFFAAVLFFVVCSSALNPIFDQRHVSEVAVQILHQDYSSFLKGGYGRTFDNQQGIILFLAFIYRLFGEGNTLAVQYINVACMVGFVMIWHRFLEHIWPKKADMICIWICLFIPFWAYVTFVYGTIPYLFFSAIAILLEYEYLHFNRSILFMVFSGTCMGVAIMIKTNALIILLAMLVYAMIYLMANVKEKQIIYRCVFSILAVLMIYVLFSFGLKTYMKKMTGMEDLSGSPRTAHIAMGLQDPDGKAPGWYNGYISQVIEENGYDHELADQAAIENIRERLSYLASSPASAIGLFSKKITSQWCEPTYESLFIMMSRESMIKPSAWLGWSLDDGVGAPVLLWIMNIIQSVLYVGAFLYFSFSLFQAEKKRVGGLSELLPAIVFLGGFFFHLMWEANSQYATIYVLMLIGYAAQGVCFLRDFLIKEVSVFRGEQRSIAQHIKRYISPAYIPAVLLILSIVIIGLIPASTSVAKLFKMNWGTESYHQYREEADSSKQNQGLQELPNGRYIIHPYIDPQKVLGIPEDEKMLSGAKCAVIPASEDNRVILTRQEQSYVLRFQQSQLVLDITEAKTDPGTNAQQWEYNGDVSQLFQFTETSDGIYAILYNGHMALTVDESNGNVVIMEYTASDQQLWSMEKQ